jgi:hypothetical protein
VKIKNIKNIQENSTKETAYKIFNINFEKSGNISNLIFSKLNLLNHIIYIFIIQNKK